MSNTKTEREFNTLETASIDAIQLADSWLNHSERICPGDLSLALQSCALDLKRLAESWTHSLNPLVRCIDETLAVLVSRLEAKQPMYHPDSEWNAIMKTCESLRDAKRDIERYVAPIKKGRATNGKSHR